MILARRFFINKSGRVHKVPKECDRITSVVVTNMRRKKVLNSPAPFSFRRYLYYLVVLHSRASSVKAVLTVRENISKFQRFEKRRTGSAEMKALSVVLPLFLTISCVSGKQLFKYNCSFSFQMRN